MIDWQPIETAPKDTHILVTDGESFATAEFGYIGWIQSPMAWEGGDRGGLKHLEFEPRTAAMVASTSPITERENDEHDSASYQRLPSRGLQRNRLWHVYIHMHGVDADLRQARQPNRPWRPECP
jgi:hypothetical protein